MSITHMQSDARLRWVQKNRKGEERVRRAGAAIQRTIQEAVSDRGVSAAKLVATAIAGVVDSEFRAHCRIYVSEHGALIVHVNEPALVYAMRVQWSEVIRSVLSGIRNNTLTNGISFRYGSAGVQVG